MRPDQRSALQLLRDHHSTGGITAVEATTHFGSSRLQARVFELEGMGWPIQRYDRSSGETAYSCDPSIRTPGTEDICQAGIILRYGTRKGWTIRTHGDALKPGRQVPAKILDQAEAAAVKAYQDIVKPYLIPTSVIEDDDREDIFAFIDEINARNARASK